MVHFYISHESIKQIGIKCRQSFIVSGYKCTYLKEALVATTLIIFIQFDFTLFS